MKILKSRLFFFLLGAIVTSTVAVATTRLSANSIIYIKSNNEETTLDLVIDELYTKSATYKDLSTETHIQSSDLLLKKKAYDSDGNLVTGNIGTYSGDTIVTPTNTSTTLNTSGKYLNSNITVSAIGSPYYDISASTNVTASALLSGVVAYNSSGQQVAGNISTYNGSTTVTPTTSEQTLSTSGKYLSNNIKVNAIPSDYKDIHLSTVTSDSDIVSGKVAYKADGTKLEGTNTAASDLATCQSDLTAATSEEIVSYGVVCYTVQAGLGNCNLYLPDLTNYKTIKIEYAKLSSGSVKQFVLRQGSNDPLSFSASNSEINLNVTNITGAATLVFYAQNMSAWGTISIGKVTLVK